MDMAVYAVNRGKAIAAFRVVDDLKKGLNLVVAHIDSPRLDFKPNPLVEDEQIALFKTHYYGGIRSITGSTYLLRYTVFSSKEMEKR